MTGTKDHLGKHRTACKQTWINNTICCYCILGIRSFLGLAALDSSGSDNSSSSAGGPSHHSEEPGVVDAIVEDDVVDPFKVLDGSGDEAEVMIPDVAPVGVGVIILAEPVVEPAPPPVGPVPAAPAWDIGAQRGEVAKDGRSKCVICDVPCPKGDVRLVYQPFKSHHRFIHPLCTDRIPVEQHPHSVATLRFQLDFGGGPDVLAINTSIEAALAKVM